MIEVSAPATCSASASSEHVSGGGPQQLAPAQREQARHRTGLVGLVVAAEHGVGLGAQGGRLARLEQLVVGEHRDRRRRPHQQVGRIPAGGEQPGHPPGHVGVVAQQPQVPGRAAERLADLAEGQQSRVRSRRVGEPAEQGGQQRALDRRLPAHAGGQRLDVPQRAGRVDVAERLEPVLRGLRGQPDHVAGQPGDGVEQRPVEQLLVQLPGHGRVLAPGQGKFFRRIDRPGRVRCAQVAEPSQGPAELAQQRGVGGQRVRPAELAELEQVFDRAQESVGVGQVSRVVPADVAAGRERLERRQRRRLAQRLIRPAVHELQQLDRELDVPQAAGTELDLPVGFAGGQVRDYPAAHRLHVGHEVVASGGLPDEAGDGGDVVLAEFGVSGDRPGLEQCLELPGLRPALVIGQMAGDRSAPAGRCGLLGEGWRRPGTSRPRPRARSRS